MLICFACDTLQAVFNKTFELLYRSFYLEILFLMSLVSIVLCSYTYYKPVLVPTLNYG
jgi:hypothetical protein